MEEDEILNKTAVISLIIKHYNVNPPSIVITEPVVKAESSDAK